ncbi:MAG: hypothetical protein AAFP68_01325 [Pseudomonadota bacterium]
MNKSIASILTTVLAPLMLMACQTSGTTSSLTPASAPMPPVEQRLVEPGASYTILQQDGSELAVEILSTDGNLVLSKSSSGCSWKRDFTGFRPNPEWNSCGGSTGTQTSTRTSGSIFPLVVGNTETWDYSGTNSNGDAWESTRNCKVEAEVSVTVPAGTFDTYHVRCEDRWWVREWFVDQRGLAIQYARTRKIGSADRNRSGKLVSYTPANT